MTLEALFTGAVGLGCDTVFLSNSRWQAIVEAYICELPLLLLFILKYIWLFPKDWEEEKN